MIAFYSRQASVNSTHKVGFVKDKESSIGGAKNSSIKKQPIILFYKKISAFIMAFNQFS
jgi:hypothetical protein